MGKMAQRVKTTPEERERIEKQFVRVMNVLYDEYLVFDGDYDIRFIHKESGFNGGVEPFTSDHVKITQVWSDQKVAHIASDSDDYWKLGVKFESWRDTSPLRRFKTLVHEAAHIPDTLNDHLGTLGYEYDFDINGVDSRSHPLRFWLTYAMLADRINNRRKLLSPALYDVPVTGDYVICDVINNAGRYASGIENAQHWTDAIFDQVDYSKELFAVFGDSIHGIYNERFEEDIDTDELRDVVVEKVDFEMMTDAELYDEFKEEFELPGEDDIWSTPRIELPHRPRVRERKRIGGEPIKYRVEDGDEALFALLARRGLPTIPCEVTRTLG